jgi:hypothetical protein
VKLSFNGSSDTAEGSQLQNDLDDIWGNLMDCLEVPSGSAASSSIEASTTGASAASLEDGASDAGTVKDKSKKRKGDTEIDAGDSCGPKKKKPAKKESTAADSSLAAMLSGTFVTSSNSHSTHYFKAFNKAEATILEANQLIASLANDEESMSVSAS